MPLGAQEKTSTSHVKDVIATETSDPSLVQATGVKHAESGLCQPGFSVQENTPKGNVNDVIVTDTITCQPGVYLPKNEDDVHDNEDQDGKSIDSEDDEPDETDEQYINIDRGVITSKGNDRNSGNQRRKSSVCTTPRREPC